MLMNVDDHDHGFCVIDDVTMMMMMMMMMMMTMMMMTMMMMTTKSILVSLFSGSQNEPSLSDSCNWSIVWVVVLNILMYIL